MSATLENVIVARSAAVDAAYPDAAAAESTAVTPGDWPTRRLPGAAW
jgi:hypothetical protein